MALVLSLCSCSANWHIRKAKKKDPSLFDTVETVDTVVLEVPKVDTLFKQVRDTLIEYIQKDSIGQEVKIKYLYNTVTDSVFIEVDCPDPEIITKTVTNTVEIKPTIWQQIKWFIMVLGLIAIWLGIKKII